mgnify:CR=1 FL=1
MAATAVTVRTGSATKRNETGAIIGRCAVLLAVLLQAGGQVAYGTYLWALPSPLFVFVSFLAAMLFFLAVSGRGAGAPAWKPLLVLNVATALTFLSFFYALKLVEPAIAGAINVGIGPLAAVLIALTTTGTRPSARRLVVCLGVLFGCAVLAVSATRGHGPVDVSAGWVWSGVLASVATGCGAVLITMASKALLERGWASGAVLAHRFYLILPVSLGLALATSDPSRIDWSLHLVLTVGAVAALGVVAPLYLLQVGIRRTDPYSHGHHGGDAHCDLRLAGFVPCLCLDMADCARPRGRRRVHHRGHRDQSEASASRAAERQLIRAIDQKRTGSFPPQIADWRDGSGRLEAVYPLSTLHCRSGRSRTFPKRSLEHLWNCAAA